MQERGPQPSDADSPPPAAETPTAPASTGDLATAGSNPIELDQEPFQLSGARASLDSEKQGPPRSRTRTIVLASLLVAGLAGAATLGWVGWQISSQKDASVTTPATVAGLRLDDSENGRATADYLQSALAAEIDLDQAVGAVYTDGSNHNVLFFGGTALIWSPGSELEQAFTLISDDQGAVAAVHDVPAGEYGGTMRCGTTQTPEGAIPVCGWADHGSLAVAMFPNRTEPDSAKLMLQLRGAVQQRG